MKNNFSIPAFLLAGVLSASVIAFADYKAATEHTQALAVAQASVVARKKFQLEAPPALNPTLRRIKSILPIPSPEPSPEPPVLLKPNEVGNVMIVMYHGILEDEPKEDFMTTVEAFKNDLLTMYNQGYRLIPISDLMDNKINVPAGYTPIVLTFDDGMPTAFSLVEQPDGSLLPRENCGVDLINKFSEQYPDFGKAAVFFINGKGHEPFYGAGTYADRFKYLTDNGYEIGNHTFSHGDLKKADADKIQWEVARLDELVQNNLPGYNIRCLAYPYGNRPGEVLREFVLNGSSEGISYNYTWALKEGQSEMSAAPNHKLYDPFNIPRVRGTHNAVTDLGWCFEYYKNNPHERYVSDGDPDIISVPVEYSQYVDTDSLGDKELNIYLEEEF